MLTNTTLRIAPASTPEFTKSLQTDDRTRFSELVHHLHRGENANYRVLFTTDTKTTDWRSIPGDYMPQDDWLTGKNVYFSVHPLRDKTPGRWASSRNEYVSAINAFLAEYDGKDFIDQDEWLPHYEQPDLTEYDTDAKKRGSLQRAQTAAIDAAYKAAPDTYKERAAAHIKSLDLQPSVIWASGGGYQCLWLLSDTVEITDANRAEIAHYHRAFVHMVGGDPAACDLRRVLRVPGTYNVKPKYAPDYPKVVFVRFDMGSLYDYAELTALLPDLAQRPERKRAKTYIPADVHLGDVGEVVHLPNHPAIRRYNDTHDLRAMLIDIGYTDHGNGRMSRPGATSQGVALMNRGTKAYIFSTSDPLYSERPITPADVAIVYAFGGDMVGFLRSIGAAPVDNAALADYLKRLHTPENIWAMKEEGAANAEKLRTLLDTLAEITQHEGTTWITPGYDALSKKSGISLGGIGAYLATAYSLGYIDMQTGEKGGCASSIQLVLQRLNRLSQGDVSPIQNVQNWIEAYREYRGDELFLRGHYAYTSTRPNADLDAFGEAGLPVIAALQEGELELATADEKTGHGYHTNARILRRMFATGLVDVVVGARNRKTYALKPEFREILEEKRPRFTTYAVNLQRGVRRLESRERYRRRNGDKEAADRLLAELERMQELWAKVKAKAGIVNYEPPNKRRGKRERMAQLVRVGERRERHMNRLTWQDQAEYELKRQIGKHAGTNAEFDSMLYYAHLADMPELGATP